jgi:putative ABC transport system substrate-binding protein
MRFRARKGLAGTVGLTPRLDSEQFRSAQGPAAPSVIRQGRGRCPALATEGEQAPHVRHETTGVHHAAWRRGDRVAAASRAQQGERVRRIGVLMVGAADDPQSMPRIAAFLQGLQQLGWTDGRNVRIDARWAAGDFQRLRNYVAELIAIAPDVVLATGGSVVGPLQQASRTVPIVFVLVPDPVGAGFVASLARPGGNATGFTIFEYGMSAKWLELLKQIAPGVTRVAVLRDPASPDGIGQFAALQGAAPTLGAELSPIDVRDAGEVERSLGAFARGSNGGVVVTGSGSAILHRERIIALAAITNCLRSIHSGSLPAAAA